MYYRLDRGVHEISISEIDFPRVIFSPSVSFLLRCINQSFGSICRRYTSIQELIKAAAGARFR